jgi:putative membrane protein
MKPADAAGIGAGRRGLLIAAAAVAAAAVLWAVVSTKARIEAVGGATIDALWVLPLIIPIHLVQLLLSAVAWRGLLPAPLAGVAGYFRLRLIREGIDSLFPVAQIGGEMVAARMLAKRGMAGVQAAAGVIVDVSLEVLSQAIFLLAGVAALATLAGGGGVAEWLGPLVLAAVAGGGFLLAQRFGLLRLLELLAAQIAERFPDAAGLSLTGLNAAAQAIYRRRGPVIRATGLHFASWSLGTIETWIILSALNVPASLTQAIVVETLGMASRTAGFAVPGALAVQEGGFALAAMSAGLPDAAGLSVSLVKRVREVVVGIAGVALARQSR